MGAWFIVQSTMSATSTATFSLNEWLTKAVQFKASDAHFHSNYPPLFRINGVMTPFGEDKLTADKILAEIVKVLTPEEKQKFITNKDLDFVHEIPQVGRFRASVFSTHSGINTSFRIIPGKASSLEELGLPAELKRFIDFHHGLLLITGPAGSGKSTTLASLINLINEHHSGHHILSLEDPIEIMHQNKQCVINQRQVIHHTQSYARAMRAALREDPDIVVIGEMRDAETIALALTASETGHLVMASMHTTNAVKSISRIIDSFPPEKQSQIRTMLSESLQAVFSQQLLPSATGDSRVPAYELLFVTSAISNLIREKKTFQIPSAMQMGKLQGMMTLNQCIGDLLRAGKISPETAKRYSEDGA